MKVHYFYLHIHLLSKLEIQQRPAIFQDIWITSWAGVQRLDKSAAHWENVDQVQEIILTGTDEKFVKIH